MSTFLWKLYSPGKCSHRWNSGSQGFIQKQSKKILLTRNCLLPKLFNRRISQPTQGYFDIFPAPVHNIKISISQALNDDTKILTETDTETFFTIPNFPKPKPRLFSETKFFRNRNRYFSSETKFSETETETFFPKPNFPIPKPKPSKNWQKFRNREVSKPKCQSLARACVWQQ